MRSVLHVFLTSYEPFFSLTQILQELLALGDKMGTVSTALSEEALLRSLLKSIYQETDETGPNSLKKDDDNKCSICQVSLLSNANY